MGTSRAEAYPGYAQYCVYMHDVTLTLETVCKTANSKLTYSYLPTKFLYEFNGTDFVNLYDTHRLTEEEASNVAQHGYSFERLKEIAGVPMSDKLPAWMPYMNGWYSTNAFDRSSALHSINRIMFVANKQRGFFVPRQLVNYNPSHLVGNADHSERFLLNSCGEISGMDGREYCNYDTPNRPYGTQWNYVEHVPTFQLEVPVLPQAVPVSTLANPFVSSGLIQSFELDSADEFPSQFQEIMNQQQQKKFELAEKPFN